MRTRAPKRISPQRPHLKRITVPKSYGVLAARLREAILEGDFEQGTRLPTERELVDQTGLSRGSVREALRMLEVEGLVRPRPGRFGGNIVSRPDHDAMAGFVGRFMRSHRLPLRMLQEARETIEPALARLAAINRTAQDLDLLRALNRELAADNIDSAAFAAVNMKWHNAVAAASANELLSALLYAMSHGVIIATTDEVYDTVAIRKAVTAAHERIVDAIDHRDGDAAFRRMERHVRAAREHTRSRESAELTLDPADD
jgi:GntR family transcriptional repressor for pyruvate dehydrogenase complex